MPEVEHGFPRIGALILPFLLISLLIQATGARGEESLFPGADRLVEDGLIEEARAELLRVAEESAGTEREWRALFRLNELERDGPKYFGRLIELTEMWGGAEAWLALGRYRFAVGAYEAAAADFRNAEDGLSGEEKAEAACWRGLSLVAAGEREEGLDLLLDTAKKKDAGRAAPRARFLAARIYWNGGEEGRASSTIRENLKDDHDYSGPSLLLAARIIEFRGRTDQARERYAEVASRFPGSGEAEEARRALLRMEKTLEVEPGWYVQIASFESEENARRFVAARRAEGVGAIDSYRIEREDRVLFPVRIGPFDSEEEAETARQNLEGQGIPGSVVAEGDEG